MQLELVSFVRSVKTFRVACRIALGAVLLTNLAAGCRDAADPGYGPPPAVEGTGGTPAAGTGGKAGTGGSKGTGGNKATGGSSGSTGSDGAPAGTADSGADATSDAPLSTPEVGTGTPDVAVADVVTGPETAPGQVAVCWPDPRVIKICHQLENACENCPPGGAPPKNKTAQVCFDLIKKAYAGMATDEDCAKFAVDNKCTVDNVATTGNVCGSLNCYAPGCRDKARCLNRQQWGDSSMCAPFMATCGPCK
jgi:hypothetical protein